MWKPVWNAPPGGILIPPPVRITKKRSSPPWAVASGTRLAAASAAVLSTIATAPANNAARARGINYGPSHGQEVGWSAPAAKAASMRPGGQAVRGQPSADVGERKRRGG